MYSTESFEKAQQKAIEAEDESDLETDAETATHSQVAHKRRHRPINTRSMDSDSESEDELRTACFAKKRLVATVDSVE
ncbi:hypothetical protein DPMN_045417 [Dreissena polymorpha]|uniref:Uncharacterized protein n=1 Tax=Dreissena polymorpha TaxID=45954 RepID=A0A9D4HZM3_DREPO|nr:hypothetical protein DPMN_045417 [Dreissena polymorpha]